MFHAEIEVVPTSVITAIEIPEITKQIQLHSVNLVIKDFET